METMHLRRRVALISASLASCAALGIAGSAIVAGSASGATKPTTTKITVTASEFKFKLSKTSAPVGTVVFTVKNVGKIGHNFKINGKVTKIIAAGKSATLTVKFTKKGKFAYLCTVPGHAKLGMKGVFGVAVKPPVVTAPATTAAPTTFPGPGGTVAVSMFEYGFTLNPATIPSGNVTFVVTNTGTATHNFDISGVTGGDGAFLNAGASASFTVNLQAGKTYQYLCDVPGHADAGMRGTFVPTP
jgi:uncharacterized cupredoxin-like copper-binding protein